MKYYLTILTIILCGFSYSQESKIEQIEIDSKFLNEPRMLTLYIPENFSSSKEYGVIFCTDGQFINEQYRLKLDSLFETQMIAPFVIVGVNSNEEKLPNEVFEYRNYEYLEYLGKGQDSIKSTRFANHLDFFVKEVLDSVVKKMDLKVKNKYFYGVSNGAAFGVQLSKYYPELFSKYILYSSAGAEFDDLKWTSQEYPFFVIAYGNEEPTPLVEESKALSEHLTQNKYQHTISVFNGAHRREDWLKQFIRDILLLRQ